MIPLSCEQYANNATTELAAPVSLIDLTITVVSAVLFPTTTPFRIIIDEEVMMVTGIALNVFTVTRGIEESTITTHISGTTIFQSLTYLGLCAFSECRFATDTRVNLPTPELDGRLFLTQSPGWYLFREDGIAWRAWGPIFQLYEGLDFEEDTWQIINFTDGINTANVGVENDGGIIFGVDANTVLGENVKMLVQDVSAIIPISPPYAVTMAFNPNLFPADQTYCGLVFRDSVTEEFIFFKLMYDSTSITKRDIVMSVDKYTDPNTLVSAYVTLSAGTLIAPMVWFKMEDDGVNLNWYFSNDGLNFMLVTSQLRTNFLGLGPDQIGVAIGTNNTTGGATINIHSWLKE
jgi:hypothetical protein